RNDILNRDLVRKTWEDASGCEVRTGILHDPYTGRTIHFRRGIETSLAVQIDHMVALANAWQTGARRWSPTRREAFANDPRELIAVYGPANEAKGDDDASGWLPPRRAFDCQYVADQVMVKHLYGLWVTPSERHAMAGVLDRCR
ncbi:MAG TPA: HNH endonuclease family protein, partial [Gaiellales bacterium]|nr:HNH endonuclease family protein [Gaiellales bacterium]